MSKKRRASKFDLERAFVPLLFVLRDKGFLTPQAIQNITANTVREIGKKAWLLMEKQEEKQDENPKA